MEEYYEYKENTLRNRYIIVFYYAYHFVHISFVIFNLELLLLLLTYTRLITYLCILRNSDNCPTGHMPLLFF